MITRDVPGAFTQDNIDDFVHMRMKGALAELLTKVDPELYKHLVIEKGKTVWHFDDLKTSHVDISECEKVVDVLNMCYGNETTVTVTRTTKWI